MAATASTSKPLRERTVSTEHVVGGFPELATMFDFALSSHEIGHVKPDAAAYRYLLTRTNAEAENVYFFDDLQPNVEGARAFGIKANQVEGISALKNALKREGLYAESDA